MQDTVLHLDKMGNSAFSGLKVNEELSLDLRQEVSRILSNIYEEENGQGIDLIQAAHMLCSRYAC